MSLRPLRYLHRTSAQTETIKPLERTRTLTEIVLNDDMLAAISRRSDILTHFPFMRLVQPPQAPRGSCKKCNQTAAERTHIQHEIERVRSVLVQMTPEQKTLLKQKLNADSIVLYYKTSSNTVERTQF